MIQVSVKDMRIIWIRARAEGYKSLNDVLCWFIRHTRVDGRSEVFVSETIFLGPVQKSVPEECSSPRECVNCHKAYCDLLRQRTVLKFLSRVFHTFHLSCAMLLSVTAVYIRRYPTSWTQWISSIISKCSCFPLMILSRLTERTKCRIGIPKLKKKQNSSTYYKYEHKVKLWVGLRMLPHINDVILQYVYMKL